jgi:hypothetical protein
MHAHPQELESLVLHFFKKQSRGWIWWLMPVDPSYSGGSLFKASPGNKLDSISQVVCSCDPSYKR